MSNLKNTVDDKTEQAVIDCAIAYIAYIAYIAILPMDNTEPVISSENKVFLFQATVLDVFDLRHALENFNKRLGVL